MKRIVFFVVALVCSTLPAFAQGGGNVLATSLKNLYEGSKRNLVEAAQKIPESEYGFKPTPDVRSMGELFAHVANTQFTYCAISKNEASPNKEDFEKRTAKADIVKALNESFAYCDGIFGTATDAMLTDMVKLQGPANATPRPRGQQMVANIAHNNEHYGNLVTYMRIKGIVPPSTERTQGPPR